MHWQAGIELLVKVMRESLLTVLKVLYISLVSTLVKLLILQQSVDP